MKKFVSMLMALVMSMGLLSSVTAYAQSYPDVDEGHWAYVWVEYMNSHGYIHGYPDGNYRPAQEITRAEFVTILNYIFNSTGTTNKNYIDVKEGDWYYNQIHAAVAAGYLHGYDDATEEHDGTMKPNNKITREEAAVVIAGAYGLELNDDVSKFSDAEDICSWAVPYVGALSAIGAVSGDAETAAYRPHDYLLRAEAATMIAQSDKVINGEIKKVTLPETLVKEETTHTIENITTEGLENDAKIGLSLSYVETGDVGHHMVTAYIGEEVIAKDMLINEFVAFLKEKTFTPEEIANLSIAFHEFDGAEDGSSLHITLNAFDAVTNEVYDTKEYMITFGDASVHWQETLTKESKETYTLSDVITNYDKKMHLEIAEFKKADIKKYTLTLKIGEEVIASEVTLEELNEILKEKELTAQDVDNLVVTIDIDAPTSGSALSLNFKLVDSETNKIIGKSKTYDISYKTPTGGGPSSPSIPPVETSRDRVVESLQDYQNGVTNSSPSKQIATDYTTHGISSDMLKVILTNDGMNTFNSGISQTTYSANVDAVFNSIKDLVLGDTVDGESLFTRLYPVYEDVIAHVIADARFDYDTAVITTAEKEKYVKLFRAMVATVNGSADAAIDVYNSNRGTSGEDKFVIFRNEAINKTTTALTAILGDSFDAAEKSNIIASAVNYVNALFEANKNDGTFKTDLYTAGADGLEVDEFVTILLNYM